MGELHSDTDSLIAYREESLKNVHFSVLVAAGPGSDWEFVPAERISSPGDLWNFGKSSFSSGMSIHNPARGR